MKEKFEIGELVHYQTERGARIGEITTIDGHQNLLKVRWFSDGHVYEVPKKYAVPFNEFLNKQSSRKLKTVYAEFFGGRPMERMPQKGVKRLYRVLRDHGIDFDEFRTRANDFFPMRMNPAHLPYSKRKKLVPRSILPENVIAWLPKWLIPDSLPPSSRDPLGFQADAGQRADHLLPGLTVFTNRVGYFFFLAWAVQEFNKPNGLTSGGRREALNKLERALVLCETLYHGKDSISDCFHQGQRMKGQLLAQANTTAGIPDRILKNQNNTGCYNLYRTAMRSCGFWVDDDEAAARGYLPFRLTKRGESLASSFARREEAKALFSWAINGTGRREVRRLQEWGKSFCFCTFHNKTEKERFLDGFLFARGDSAEVIHDADTRLQTLCTLASTKLLFKPPTVKSAITLASTETAGADVSELETTDRGENVSFLLHFYRNRSVKGAEPFVVAAVYELLGLSLNAVFAGLMDEIMEHGR